MKKIILVLCLACGVCFASLLEDCENGNKEACKELVETYFNLDDNMKSTAAKIMCERNYSAFCNDYGVFLQTGKGVRQNLNEAMKYYEKSCDLGWGAGCDNLGNVYYFEKKDYKEAKNYFEKACDLNSGNGCYNLATSYYNGKGVRQDKSLAKEYYGKACDNGEQKGCDNYKKLNEQGY